METVRKAWEQAIRLHHRAWKGIDTQVCAECLEKLPEGVKEITYSNARWNWWSNGDSLSHLFEGNGGRGNAIFSLCGRMQTTWLGDINTVRPENAMWFEVSWNPRRGTLFLKTQRGHFFKTRIDPRQVIPVLRPKLIREDQFGNLVLRGSMEKWPEGLFHILFQGDLEFYVNERRRREMPHEPLWGLGMQARD